MVNDLTIDITEENLASLSDMQKAALFCDRIMGAFDRPELQGKIMNWCGVHALMIKEILIKNLCRIEGQEKAHDMQMQVGVEIYQAALQREAKLRETVEYIASQQNLFFAECSQAEAIIAKCKEALSSEY